MDESNGKKIRVIGLVEYYTLIDRLADMLKASGIMFQYVVAVARGGMAIGERLSRRLKIPLAIVAAENWPGGVKQDSVRFSRHCVYLANRPAGPLVIVDDLTETGETIAASKDYFHEKFDIPYDQMHGAVLLRKAGNAEQQPFIADPEPISPNVWVVFPPENPDIVP